MSDVATLKNIGPRSAEWLRAVGVATIDDLERLGPVEAWRRAKQAFPDEVTIVLLSALQAALLDLPWTELPADLMKQQLADAARPLERGDDGPPTRAIDAPVREMP